MLSFKALYFYFENVFEIPECKVDFGDKLISGFIVFKLAHQWSNIENKNWYLSQKNVRVVVVVKLQ